MFWRDVPHGAEMSILSPPAAHSGLALLQPALTMDVWQDGVGSSGRTRMSPEPKLSPWSEGNTLKVSGRAVISFSLWPTDHARSQRFGRIQVACQLAINK